MSSAKDRKARRTKRTDGFDVKNNKDMQAELKRRKQTRSAVIALLAFAIVAAAVFVLNSGFFYRGVTALNVDGQRFSVSEMNYYLRQTQTGAFEEASELATTSTVLNRHAVAEGLSLTPEAHEAIEARIDRYRDEAAEFGTSLNTYLGLRYGRGVNLRALRQMIEFEMLGHMYVEHFVERMQEEFTEEQLEAQYLEEVERFDRVMFRAYSFGIVPEDLEAAGMTSEEASERGLMPVEEARIAAQSVRDAAEEDGEEGFLRAVTPYMNEDWGQEADMTTIRDMSLAETDMLVYSNWLLAANRSYGDVLMQEDEHGVHVVFFLEREDNRRYTTAVRHILIRPEQAEFGEDMEVEDFMQMEAEVRAAAEARAEEILAQWRADGATEEAFIALIREYSEDYRGEDDPGFFGGIHPRMQELVEEFRDWGADESRRPGDAEIVETMFGFHIMYFVGEETERSLRHQMAANSLIISTYQEWISERLEEMNANSTFFRRLVDTF